MSRAPRAGRLAAGAAVALLVLVALAASGAPHPVDYLGTLVVAGLGLGAIAALTGVGLVLTYTTTGVFTLSQGGVATVVAFVLSVLVRDAGLPLVPALLVAVVGVGPLLGVLLEGLVFRPLQRRGASPTERLVADVGVLVLLLGACTLAFGEGTVPAPSVFPSSTAFGVGGVDVGWTTVGDLLVVLALTGGLTVLLRLTPLGRQVRAVVDRRTLAQLAAVDADRVSQLSWALGSGFAGLVGVLYAPLRGLSTGLLTLTVLATLAVAVVARLRSLPVAVLAGLGLGVGQSLVQALSFPRYPSWLPLGRISPVFGVELLVEVTLLLLVLGRAIDAPDQGSASLVGGRLGAATRRGGPAAGRRLLLVVGLALPVLLAGALSREHAVTEQRMLALGIVFLSVTALTGLTGQITLASAAFAGLGAYATARLSGGYLPLPTSVRIPHLPVLLAVLLAGALVAGLGLALAAPAVRRRGLALALLTLAFAQVVDALVFQQPLWTSAGRAVVRPHLGPLDLSGQVGFTGLEVVVLGLALGLVAALRRGRLGRALGAMRDSEAGAVSVGVSLRRHTLLVFGASALLAAVGGALLAMASGGLDLDEGGPYSPLSGIFAFAAVVVFGVASPAGALLASVTYVGVDALTGTDGSSLVVIGLLAVALGRLPGGLAGALRRGVADPRVLDGLVAHVAVEHARRAAPPVGTGLEPTATARELLGSR